MTNTPETFPRTPEQTEAEQPRLDFLAKELLRDEAISQLPPEEQGRVIADRFIGALVRQGNIEGSKITYSPADILASMDKIRTLDDVMEITRTAGLREAVLQLGNDERVAKLYGSLSPRLKSQFDDEGNEKFTLTSVAQVEGYLQAGGDKNSMDSAVPGVHMSGDSWMPVVLSEIKHMSEDPTRKWSTTTEAGDLMTSDIASIRQTARTWEKAINSAQAVGVDTELLKRSAEKIQQRTRAGADLGATALFIETGYRIDDYNALTERIFRR